VTVGVPSIEKSVLGWEPKWFAETRKARISARFRAVSEQSDNMGESQ
jgi:hypothetical protein